MMRFEKLDVVSSKIEEHGSSHTHTTFEVTLSCTRCGTLARTNGVLEIYKISEISLKIMRSLKVVAKCRTCLGCGTASALPIKSRRMFVEQMSKHLNEQFNTHVEPVAERIRARLPVPTD